LVITLALLLALVAPSAAGAQEQGQATISVTAGIGGVVTISVCDTTADFGDGLTPDGNQPANPTDAVRTSFPGAPWLGQGIFYIWTPSCAAGEVFLQIQSSVDWDASYCAMEDTGDANLSVADGDLRWANRQGFRFEFPHPPTYDFDQLSLYSDINHLSNPFPTTCEPGNWVTDQGAGARAIDLRFALRVDLDAGSGDFASTVTWNVTPS
jgi:hypothetical protein